MDSKIKSVLEVLIKRLPYTIIPDAYKKEKEKDDTRKESH